MTPNFMIIAAGVNITSQISERLLRLTVTDEAGDRADAVEIELDDADGAIELPTPGAPILVFLGYRETGLMPMGVFTSDEVTLSGPPATLIIRGKAANLGGSIKEQKSRSWDGISIGDMVSTIAAEHGLDAKVAAAFAPVHYNHLDQTDESDLNFLIRVAKNHDALATVKGGALLFVARAAGITASGLTMLPQFLRAKDVTSWSASLTTRTKFSSVAASWHDRQAGERKTEIAGQGVPQKRLQQLFGSMGEAEAAAKAKLDELSRAADTFDIAMPGNPILTAETPIMALGFRAGIDGPWTAKSVTHELSGGGLMTSLSAERGGRA